MRSLYIWEALSISCGVRCRSKLVHNHARAWRLEWYVCHPSDPVPLCDTTSRCSVSALVFPVTVLRSQASQLVSVFEKRSPFSFLKLGRPRFCPSSLAKWLQSTRLRRPFIGTSIPGVSAFAIIHVHIVHTSLLKPYTAVKSAAQLLWMGGLVFRSCI